MDRREARRLFIGVTDQSWYDFLSAEPDVDEVNFWRPGGGLLNAMQGAPFLFKLKAPLNAIAGVGFFERAERLTVEDAWEFYGRKNGGASLAALCAAIGRNRHELVGRTDVIGCIVLSQPTFFSRFLWLDQPRDWRPNTVVGKSYDMDDGEGARVWAQVTERLGAALPPLALSVLDKEFGGQGKPAVYLPRQGQGTFRRLVLSAYENRCAITGERAIPVVEAAHIVDFSEQQRHAISNGIALRADIHKLFDSGYVSIRPDYKFVVSSSLRDEYKNGRVYYDLEAQLGQQTIRLPAEVQLQPKREHLERHYSEKFKR
jgi:putative restriction endonuclease